MTMINQPLWVFSAKNPETIPSYVVGGIIPAQALLITSIIFLKNHNPILILDKYRPSTIIVSKIFHQNVLNLIIESKKRNIKIITVFDDWHFDKNIINKRHNFNLVAAKEATKIVVKTEEAKKVLRSNLFLEALVIPDCLRFKSQKPIKNINYPFRISWFGMSTNLDTLVFGIKQISATNLRCIITIHINNILSCSKYIIPLQNENIKIDIIEWKKNMDLEVIKNDIVIIPYINDTKRRVKSSNRIIDSINLGQYLIMSDVPQFSEFKDFVYSGNIGYGLNWLLKNKKLAINQINKGQKFIQNNYGNKITIKKWRDLIF